MKIILCLLDIKRGLKVLYVYVLHVALSLIFISIIYVYNNQQIYQQI